MADAVAAVRRAARAEKAVEKTRAEAEREWRQAWWVTTMALADAPDAEGVKAANEVLNQSATWIRSRRRCGAWFKNLENREVGELIPRYAVAAAQAAAAQVKAGIVDLDPETAADLIIQAEHEDCGVRAFNAMLTGRSWTNAPENMTDAERLHVARTEIKKRPHEVLDDDETREAADEASIEIRASQPRPRITDEYADHVVNQAGKSMADRMGTEIPLEHLDAAAGEIASALHARTVHGVKDTKSWNRKLDEIHRMEDMARMEDESWTEADQELLRSFTGGN
jgi:hypothetical protein